MSAPGGHRGRCGGRACWSSGELAAGSGRRWKRARRLRAAVKSFCQGQRAGRCSVHLRAVRVSRPGIRRSRRHLTRPDRRPRTTTAAPPPGTMTAARRRRSTRAQRPKTATTRPGAPTRTASIATPRLAPPTQRRKPLTHQQIGGSRMRKPCSGGPFFSQAGRNRPADRWIQAEIRRSAGRTRVDSNALEIRASSTRASRLRYASVEFAGAFPRAQWRGGEQHLTVSLTCIGCDS